jgi:DNA-binding CsgD family transcriptional regulator
MDRKRKGGLTVSTERTEHIQERDTPIGGAINASLAIAESISALAALPAVATNDWSERAADAIARLGGDEGRACVLLVADEHRHNGDEGGDPFRIDSVGVRSGTAEARQSAQNEQEVTQLVRLERVRGFGFLRTPRMKENGLAGRMSDLDAHWRDTALGRVWAGVPVRDVLLGVCPIEGNRGASVVCMFAQAEGAAEISAEAFGSVTAVLGRRAALMYETMGASRGASSGVSGSAPDSGLRWLTSREQDVLESLVDGLSVREIADKLGRSRHTMHDHVKNLHKKLNASCRGELVAAALGHVDRDGRSALRMPIVIGAEKTRAPISELKPNAIQRATSASSSGAARGGND